MMKVIVLFLIIVMWNEKRFGREMVQNEPFVKNLTNFSRNTTPCYIYYIIYTYCHTKKRFFAKCTKRLKFFVQKVKDLKKQKNF